MLIRISYSRIAPLAGSAGADLAANAASVLPPEFIRATWRLIGDER
jgi:hypothetical protein